MPNVSPCSVATRIAERRQSDFSRRHALAALGRWLAAGLRGAADCVLAWQHRIGERQALREMDDRSLQDIGLSRCGVEREATKPFWRV
jgi:uncharacterized protein YjiS (DUF1127 family)